MSSGRRGAFPRSSGSFFGLGYGLTWTVGGRIVTLDGIVTGAIEVAVVLVVAAFVRRFRSGAAGAQ